MSQTQETCPAELPNWCAQRHWAIFWVIILCSSGTICGRIATINQVTPGGETPLFSANDRSRWATIRALADEGTYQIDNVIADRESIAWNTIDKVKHVGADGEFHFYSSKPPLLPTLLAGGYWTLQRVTGWNLKDNPHAVVRTMLLLFNGGGWFLFLFFFAKAANAVPVRDWTRYYALGCAGFATYLSTFSVTLNNHLPAAVAVMIALYLLAEIYRKPSVSGWQYAMAGLASGFGVANELPALAFAAAAGLLCLFRSPKKTMLAFVPAGLLIAVALLGTNFLAHQTWQLAYAHRSDGEVFATVEGDYESELEAGQLPAELHGMTKDEIPMLSPTLEPGGWPSTPEDTRRWVVRDRTGTGQYAITSARGSKQFQIHRWNNWYDYPGSYWLTHNDDRKSAVDRGEVSLVTYSFHVLFGHHGIFSLTPIWLLAFAGMLALAAGVKLGGGFQMRWLGWMGLVLSVIVVAFYLRRPEMDRNYGGVTSGLRWVFWLAPIWLLSMMPVIDWLARTRSGKFVCYLLLFVSILSAAYANGNPWVHPWLYEMWPKS